MINEIKLILKAQEHYNKWLWDAKLSARAKKIHMTKYYNIIEMFTNSNEHGIAILLENYHFRDAIFLLKSHNDPEYEYLYKLQA